MGYHVSEVRGLKELIFDYRSHGVPSIEDSYGHVAHLLGGAACLTGGVTSSSQGKVEAVIGGGHTSLGKESNHC
jgi:hypothetical protein